jgi:hypothetical protein
MYKLPHRRIEFIKKISLSQLTLCLNELDEIKYHQNKTAFITIPPNEILIEEINPNNLPVVLGHYHQLPTTESSRY